MITDTELYSHNERSLKEELVELHSLLQQAEWEVLFKKIESEYSKYEISATAILAKAFDQLLPGIFDCALQDENGYQFKDQVQFTMNGRQYLLKCEFLIIDKSQAFFEFFLMIEPEGYQSFTVPLAVIKQTFKGSAGILKPGSIAMRKWGRYNSDGGLVLSHSQARPKILEENPIVFQGSSTGLIMLSDGVLRVLLKVFPGKSEFTAAITTQSKQVDNARKETPWTELKARELGYSQSNYSKKIFMKDYFNQ